MDLIPIQPNLLVNVEKISTIKMQKNSKGVMSVIVTVDNKNISLDLPLEDFLRSLRESGANLNEQHWAI